MGLSYAGSGGGTTLQCFIDVTPLFASMQAVCVSHHECCTLVRASLTLLLS